jgi:Carboxypeptidase regulatory-like domain/TonB dependent receptor
MGPFLPRWTKWLLVLTLCLCRAAYAQFSGTTITGVVQDSSKAVIPSANLRLINTQTGAENDSTTNHEGGFLLSGVLAGTYTLQVESSGFATTQVRGITLAAGDTKSLLIRMKVGSVAETVNVDASGLVMNTTTAAVSMTADRKFVENLPLNGRSFPDLILLTPGIVTQNPQAAGRGNSTVGEFSVNGQQPGANSFYVDGVSANVGLVLPGGGSRLASTGSIAGTTALGTTQTLVSVDALQEFRVLTSTYSAEYGRTPGGQFNFVTRSGMDGLHGSVYDYFRHDTLDAFDYFQTESARTFNQYDSGATLGGSLPWAKHSSRKSYAFGSYEGLYVAQPTPPLFEYGPSYEIQDGGYPETWPQAPAEVRPILQAFGGGGQEIVSADGQPTGMSYALASDHALPSHVNATSIRFDQILGARSSFFVRYADTPSFGQTEQVTALSRNQVHSQTLTVDSSTQFLSGRNNEFVLGYVTNHSNLETNIEPYFPAPGTVNLVSLLGVPADYGPVRGQVYIHAIGAGDSLIQTDQATGSFTQWNLRDTFVLPLRNHFLKIGFDERRLGSTFTPTALTVQANFFDRSSMAENSVSQLVVSSSSPASPQIQQFSAFADDTWKLSNALNLSLGLRWEVNPAPAGKNGQDALTAVGAITSPLRLQLAPRGTELWRTTWSNFAPRFGASWMADSRPGQELIVRGGAGVFFDTSDQPALNAFHGAGFSTSQAFAGVPLPVTAQQLNVSNALTPPFTNTLIFNFSRHLQLPYSLQWNLGIEKALGKYQSLTVSYVGASGRRLLQEQREDVSAFNPEFGDVSYFPGGLASSYDALQVKFQRTFLKGLEALASYTWAHSLDYGSTSPQFPLQYGNSDLDVRHNLEGGFAWTLPRRDRSRLSSVFVGSWTVDGRLIARTAFPVDLAGNFFFDTVTGTPYYSGVDLVPNRQLYYHSRAVAGGRGFNGGPTNNRPPLLPAFVLPEGNEAGNAPRNLVRGFDLIQANIGAERNFRVRERLHLEIGGEMFNVLNHPNFGYIDPYLTDSVFGQATRMLNQSFGPTGALYQEGSPRSGEFQVRFVF